MAEQLRPVRVWDLPTRVFHWVLAGCVAGSVITAKLGGNATSWHFWFGYAAFTLLVFRVVWGLVGGRWSRFTSFVRSPATLMRYLRGQSHADEQLDVGHSPLGALSVLAVLAVLMVQVGTGLVADDEIANAGPLVSLVSGSVSSSVTTWHKTFGQWLILGLVALHVSAIVFYRLKKRIDLIGPMLHGDKQLPATTPASADGQRSRWLALLVLGLSAAAVAWVLQWGALAGGAGGG
jgi:cytochrome b